MARSPGNHLRVAIIASALFLSIAGLISSKPLAASSNTRALTIYNIHSKKTATVTFKKNGKYIPAGLKKLNWIMRDWRRDEPTKMDPKLLDLLWEVYRELGSTKPIHLISGYRSLKTNNMLRKTRGGQAKKSQHILGKAADVHFPDIPIKRLRYSALVRELGGVGYYPTSALPFVHIDTGRVRHWPRMPRYELALLFPRGRSKHVPTGGRRLNLKDVAAAQRSHKRLAIQLAKFHRIRKTSQRRILLAARNASGSNKSLSRRRVNAKLQRVASLAPPKPRLASKRARRSRLVKPSAPTSFVLTRTPRVATRPARRVVSAPKHKLISEPHLAQRPAAVPSPQSNSSEATRMGRLAAMASLLRPPRRSTDAQAGNAAQQPQRKPPMRSSGTPAMISPAANNLRSRQIARLAPVTRPAKAIPAALFEAAAPPPNSDQSAQNRWAQAPAFDEEHPDEVSYRPFPIAPLLAASNGTDVPERSQLTHPDVARTLATLDHIDTVPAMRFRPRRQVAERLMAHQFTGKAINLRSLYIYVQSEPPTKGSQLSQRQVKTSDGR